MISVLGLALALLVSYIIYKAYTTNWKRATIQDFVSFKGRHFSLLHEAQTDEAAMKQTLLDHVSSLKTDESNTKKANDPREPTVSN